MYFSADDFYTYLSRSPSRAVRVLEKFGEDRLTKRAVARIHKRAMEAIKAREDDASFEKDGEWYSFSTWKWYRPWDVVEKLKYWRAPAGDFGVGIEIELGFYPCDDEEIARRVQHWRHITLDFEGGDHPIEATFPPVRYSKFGPKSQACRYLKLVDGIATKHSPARMVGTHINISVGGREHLDSYHRRDALNGILHSSYHNTLSDRQREKYFGRAIVYGGIYSCSTHYECKMFNSVTDWKVLRRYVDISVELIKLLESEEEITLSSVVAACERGYNLR